MPRFSQYTLTLFKSMRQIIKNNPIHSRIVFNIIKNQREFLKRRYYWKKQGLQVPSFMVFSITNRCNLNCKGCYHRAQRQINNQEIDNSKLAGILGEAQELGIGAVILAGGEPLARREILSVTKQFPRMVFLLFTNGTLIDDKKIGELEQQPHVIPVFSIEGFEQETDNRRGAGIYKRTLEIMNKLKEKGVVFGVSITATRENFGTVTSKEFIDTMISSGSSLFFYADFIPIKNGTQELMPSNVQRQDLTNLVKKWRNHYPAVFMAISEEDEWGGCLSAGIGFIHINPQGDVEPCPMSPVSDANLNKVSLKEALQSDLLKKIRENRGMLNESEGGCALYDKRDWVRSLL